MGFYVAVNLSFGAANSEEGLRALSLAAQKTLKEISGGHDGKHVRWMCEAIIENPKRYVYDGNKGGMFVWSGVWNHYSYENESEALKKFLLHCWKPDLEDAKHIVMLVFGKALLLVNPEQSERTQMYEFALKDKGDNTYLTQVVVRTHETELSWNQY